MTGVTVRAETPTEIVEAVAALPVDPGPWCRRHHRGEDLRRRTSCASIPTTGEDDD